MRLLADQFSRTYSKLRSAIADFAEICKAILCQLMRSVCADETQMSIFERGQGSLELRTKNHATS